MSVEQSKKVLHDLSEIVIDGSHKNIFHLLSDFKSLSEDVHGVLPELHSLRKEDAMALSESAYELVRAMVAVLANS